MSDQAGYAVAHALALEQLQLGVDVVVECVNPSPLTRDAWIGTARTGGGSLFEVELICSDEAEHQRRIAIRSTDVEGLVKPAWEEISQREYEPWTRDRLLIDTAVLAPAESADLIRSAVAS